MTDLTPEERAEKLHALEGLAEEYQAKAAKAWLPGDQKDYRRIVAAVNREIAKLRDRE